MYIVFETCIEFICGEEKRYVDIKSVCQHWEKLSSLIIALKDMLHRTKCIHIELSKGRKYHILKKLFILFTDGLLRQDLRSFHQN